MAEPADTAYAKRFPTTYYCTFCGKSQHEVQQLIAGPGTAFICDECVDICADIVRKKRERKVQETLAAGQLQNEETK